MTAKMPILEYVLLSSSRFGWSAIKIVSETFMPNLRGFVAHSNCLRDHSIVFLSRMKVEGLEKLDLSNNGLTNASMSLIAKMSMPVLE